MATSKDEQHELDDRVDQALEEGDPKETGRLQGRLLDERSEEAEGKQKPGERPAGGEHLESGRHDAR